MLTDADLAAMRAQAEEALPDSCVISRKTRVSDGGGGGSVSWAASGTVDARIAQGSGGENQVAAQLVGQVDAILTVPSTTDLRDADRATVAGTTYEVLAVLGHADWTIAKRAAVRKVR